MTPGKALMATEVLYRLRPEDEYEYDMFHIYSCLCIADTLSFFFLIYYDIYSAAIFTVLLHRRNFAHAHALGIIIFSIYYIYRGTRDIYMYALLSLNCLSFFLCIRLARLGIDQTVYHKPIACLLNSRCLFRGKRGPTPQPHMSAPPRSCLSPAQPLSHEQPA
jgi:hypothetical protein